MTEPDHLPDTEPDTEPQEAEQESPPVPPRRARGLVLGGSVTVIRQEST